GRMTAKQRSRAQPAVAKRGKKAALPAQELLMALPAGDSAERRPVVIENVSPEGDCGRFAVKRIVGNRLHAEADAYADGHDELAVHLLYRREEETDYHEVPMTPGYDDRWTADVRLDTAGVYVYAVIAWPDRFRTWKHDLQKRIAAGQDVALELVAGARILEAAANSAPADVAKQLRQRAEAMQNEDHVIDFRTAVALDDALEAPMDRY